MVTTFAVVGIHGYGRRHLDELRRMSAEGVARLVAVADPRGAEGSDLLPPDTPVYDDLETLLDQERVDVVVIATPIHTHLPLAQTALAAGCAVQVEKPTTASLQQFRELVAAAEEAGRPVQVGFQSFGSLALDHIAEELRAGTIGQLRGIGAVGLWRRTRAYYERSVWAGRRRIDEVDVVDGAVTNPFAHAIATALRIDASTRDGDVAESTLDLFHVNDIEADDTSAVSLRTRRGTPIAAGLTLAAEEPVTAPLLVLHGTEGRMEFHYTKDQLRVVTGQDSLEKNFGRISLLRNLADHLTSGVPLRCGLADTGAFMQVLEAVRTAPAPQPVPAEHVRIVGEGQEQYRVLHEVDSWCHRVAEELSTFSALGAPWAR